MSRFAFKQGPPPSVHPMTKEPDATVPSAQTITALEYAFVKVPFEQARRSLRQQQRLIEKDCAALAADRTGDSETLLLRAKALQQRWADTRGQAAKYRSRCAMRMQLLAQVLAAPGPGHPAYKAWQETRLDRLVAEFLLRLGLGDAAQQLVLDKSLQVRVRRP